MMLLSINEVRSPENTWDRIFKELSTFNLWSSPELGVFEKEE